MEAVGVKLNEEPAGCGYHPAGSFYLSYFCFQKVFIYTRFAYYMMLLGTQRINKRGVLEIGGCDTVELAHKFGTPLYVMDEDLIRQNCRRYVSAFRALYPDTDIAFAGKSFMTTAMCRIVAQEGMFLDTASAGELHTALTAGFPMERVLLHGSNKSVEELQLAVKLGVGRIVIDNLLEIERLNDIAEKSGKRVGAMLRLTPGIDPHTHKLIRTGQADTKFGFNIKDGQAAAALEMTLESRNIELKGFHCHIGSQLLDSSTHEQAVKIMVGFIANAAGVGYKAEELNIGGGLGIRYLPEHNPPSIEEFAERIVSTLNAEIKKYNLHKPRLMLEPGRSIVGEAGTTLYTIGAIKTVPIKEHPGRRIYVSVDGGMSDNPRPALYDAKYSAIIANKAAMKGDTVVTIAGKHCETDNLIYDILLPSPQTGDILAVQSTGAYNYSMASNYNRFPRPAVVLVSSGKAEVIVKRETLDDLVKQDIIPKKLSG
jgi:diaminopimelate decarboxylase